MRSKKAAIIFGGIVLSALLVLLLTQTILAIPQQPHAFNGEVKVGGELKGGLEIRVKVLDEAENKLLPVDLTAGSVGITSSGGAFPGTFGRVSPFAVKGDVTDTPEREGANPGERLVFFLVTPDGTGDATTKSSQGIDLSKNVDLLLRPRSSQLIRGLPFLVDIIVKPGVGGSVDGVDAFLNFNTGDLEVVSIQTGSAFLDVQVSSSDNVAGTIDYKAKTRPGSPFFEAPVTIEVVLATLTLKLKGPVGITDVVFNRGASRNTTAVLGVSPVLKSLADLEIARLVEAASFCATDCPSPNAGEVLFEEGGNTTLNLAIFGPPRNLADNSPRPSNDPIPTFTWAPPATSDITGEVISFEVRIIPDQAVFTDIGNVLTFTPVTGDFADPANPDGLHTFQVRAVGTGDRKDAAVSRDFTIVTSVIPNAPELVAPADKAVLNTKTPFFDWNASSGDVNDYRLLVTSGDIVNGPFELDVVITGDTTEFQVPTGDALADGVYRWRVEARDAALNTASSVTRSFQVDTTAPDAPDLLKPPDQAFLNTGDVLFDWDGSELEVGVRVGVGDDPVNVGAGDLDRDGDADLVVVNRLTNNVSVLLNSGDGRFGGREDFAVGSLPLSVGIGELDGQNGLDMVVANFDSDNVSVLLNSGDGRFGVGEDFGVGDGPRSVGIGELDGLNGLDVVVANQLSNNVTVLLNSGDGRFGNGRNLVVGSSPRSVGIGDLDGDGDLDLVVGNFISMDITVLLNSGDGLFGTGASFTLGVKQPSSVAVGDVDGDGDLDIVTANQNSNDVTVLLNSGDGSLGAGVSIGVGAFPASVVMVDIDGDGDLDLVTTNNTSSDVSVLINRGDGSFEAAKNIGIGAKPFHVTGGDLDGDGDIDLATANNVSDDVTVMLNRNRWDVEDYVLEVVESGDGFGVRPFAIEEVITGDITEFQVESGDALADSRYRWRVIVRDVLGNLGTSDTRSFTVDTIEPTAPGNLTDVTTNPDALVRDFTWDRSTDPAPPGGTTGDASGVDFYNVLITGPVNIAATADDSEVVCTAGVCRFTTPQLVAGSYTIQVNAVDRAGNSGDFAALVFRAGPLGVVQNLQVVNPIFGNTVNVPNPAFRWNPPPPSELPSGLAAYEVAITGDASLASPFNIPFTPFTGDQFFVVCFNATGDLIGLGATCSAAVLTSDEIQLTVTEDVPEGTHTLGVRVIDLAGDAGAVAEIIFTVDITAPSPAPILVRPGSGDITADNTPFFEWTPSSGDIFDYRLLVTSGDVNAGPFDLDVVVLHPGTGHQAINPLGDGDYEWRVVAGDRALNTASSITQPFNVDTVAPAAPELVTPANDPARESFLNTSTPTFDWNASTGDPIDYQLLVTSGDIDFGPFDVDVVVPEPSTEFQVPTGEALADGVYQWRVIAGDRSLNTATSETRTFTVDTLAPGAPDLSVPPDAPARESFLSTRTPFFDWEVSTGDPFDYRLLITSGDINTGPFDEDVVITHPITEFQVPTGDDLGDAAYQWRVIARDKALNTASSVVRSFTVDAVAPGAPALVAPADAPARDSFLNTRTPIFQWAVSAGAPFEYRLLVTSGDIDAGPYDVDVLLAHPTTVFQVPTGDGLDDAVYQWRVVARDAALNTAVSVTRTFTVDTVATAAPSLVAPADDPARESFLNTRTPFLEWSPSTGDVFDYRLQVTSGDINTGPFDVDRVIVHPVTGDLVRLTGDGTYNWRVIARDKAFNAATSDTRTFTVDTLAPEAPALVAPADNALTKDRTPFFDWLESATTGDLFDYIFLLTSGDVVSGPFDLNVVITGDTTEFQVPTGDALADGVYRWRVEARDAALNTGSSATRSFQVDTTGPDAPELLIPPDQAFLNTGEVLFDWDGSAITQAERFGVEDFPFSLNAGDLDRDGDLDLVVANRFSKSVSVLLNSGDGRFTAAENFGAGTRPESVGVGDLDGDEDLDLVVANALDDDLTVLLNSGDGRFGAREDFGVGDGPRSVGLGDLDGDGDLDVVVANQLSNNVTVLLNNGDGRFGGGVEFGVGTTPRSLAIGDLDGDGDLDVVVANFGSRDVSVLLNSGDGGFEGALNFTLGVKQPNSVVVGDLDGDGDLDAVTANQPSDDVTVLLNDGNGSFGGGVVIGVGDSPRVAVMVDLDRDGDLDVVTSNSSSSDVSVLINRGDGSFEAGVPFGVGAAPFFVVVGDLDGDGDADLATANTLTDNVTVMLNRNRWDVEDFVLQVVDSGDGFGVRPFAIEEVISGDITEFQVGSGDALADSRYRWRVIGRDVLGNLGTSDTRSFTVDTIAPIVPGDLREETTADELVREFNWVRSVDPAPPGGTTGDASGVDFYRIEITGPQNILVTADDNGVVCPDRCQFSTPPLTPGQYKIDVTAVDRAANESGVATADFRAGSLAVVQNLEVVDPIIGTTTTVNTPNPSFRWEPPLELPLGLATYEIAITGDVLGSPFTILPFTPFTGDQFFVECFNATGDLIGLGAACAGAIDAGDEIKLTVTGDVPEGTHQLGVRVIDLAGDPGPTVPLTFTVDLPPAAPVLVVPRDAPARDSFFRNRSPLFDWNASTGDKPSDRDVIDYRLLVTSGDINTGSVAIDVVVNGDTTEFQVPTGDALDDGVYRWRVIARDSVLNTASSVVRTFTVDNVPPGAVVLVAPPDGVVLTGDGAPLFEWDESPTTGDIEDYLLQVVVSGDDLNTGPFAFQAVVSHPTIQFKVPLGSGLADDSYRWRVVARDKALNTASSATATFEIHIRQVDLRLESDSDVVGFGHPFDVSIVVSADGGQPVSTVSAFLEFNAGDLEVVEIRSGDVLAEVIASSFDNFGGTLGFSATTFGKAPTGEFVLAVVTFRSVNSAGNPATSINFNETFPRKTDAAFRASSVLRNLSPVSVELSGLKVDIVLETQGTVFPTSGDIPVAITVKPNGQAVDTVQAFLSFNPGDLELLSIEPGETLETELLSTSDKAGGDHRFRPIYPGDTPHRRFRPGGGDLQGQGTCQSH